jgi:hypothetical protein
MLKWEDRPLPGEEPPGYPNDLAVTDRGAGSRSEVATIPLDSPGKPAPSRLGSPGRECGGGARVRRNPQALDELKAWRSEEEEAPAKRKKKSKRKPAAPQSLTWHVLTAALHRPLYLGDFGFGGTVARGTIRWARPQPGELRPANCTGSICGSYSFPRRC